MPGLRDMEFGTVLEWKKADGDWVERGEILAVVDADKVTIEVEAPVSGQLVILASESTELSVGGPMAEIQTDAERPT